MLSDADVQCPVLAVGSGAPAIGRKVLAQLEDEVGAEASKSLTLFVDEARALYHAMGLHSGILRTFTWTRWENVTGAMDFPAQAMQGRLPFVNAGNPWQQGGCFVFPPQAGTELSQPLFSLIEESPGFPRINSTAFVAAAAFVAKSGGPAAAAGARAPA